MFDDFDTQIHSEETKEYRDYEDKRELEREQEQDAGDPPVGTYAFTARLMAEIDPAPEGDPDFWDRWKDEMKDMDLEQTVVR